jgi:hypothetical protein
MYEPGEYYVGVGMCFAPQHEAGDVAKQCREAIMIQVEQWRLLLWIVNNNIV